MIDSKYKHTILAKGEVLYSLETFFDYTCIVTNIFLTSAAIALTSITWIITVFAASSSRSNAILSVRLDEMFNFFTASYETDDIMLYLKMHYKSSELYEPTEIGYFLNEYDRNSSSFDRKECIDKLLHHEYLNLDEMLNSNLVTIENFEPTNTILI